MNALTSKCQCGTERDSINGYLICWNCDRPQPEELLGLARSKTAQDYAYEFELKRLMRVWYGE